jgi:ligand-binding SRPBCC domain-containing protein
MAEYLLERETEIARPREGVFDFFCRAENLEAITPTSLGFHMLTATPIEMRSGALIDYEISMYGFPIKWRTEITTWDPPNEFADVQLSGPYKQWIHRHIFTDTGRGTTLMKDVVRYRLPLEPLGDVAQFLVARELEKIFAYRQAKVVEIFSADQAGHSPQ